MRALVILLLLTGCAEVRMHRTFQLQTHGETRSRRYEFVALGLKPMTEPARLNELCPEGWEDIVTRKSGVQTLLTFVSLNLYSPWTVEVTCKR